MKHLFTLFTATLLSLSFLSAQTQLGADIDAEAANDRLGQSVSFSGDGSRLAVGAFVNGGNGVGAGHVRVYSWSGTSWAQLGADIDGEAAGDNAGYSVSLSGDGSRLAVGATGNDGTGNVAGHVRVYSWNGTSWTQLGADINGEAAVDQSGWSVSFSSDGSRLAVGAPFNDGSAGNAGHVRVYRWSGASWVQLGSDIDGEAAGDESGKSVSFSGDGNRVAVGATGNDGTGNGAGHVRVYRWIGTAWAQLGTDIDGEKVFDQSGYSVSLSGDGNRLAVGAGGNDGFGSNSGHVRVYNWNGASWAQLGADINGELADDLSGQSVSFSADGSRLAIGAVGNDGNGSFAGHVRVYSWSGTAWTQLGADIDGEAANDRSGNSVSFSANGSRLAIGAYLNDGTGSNAGHVRVFSCLSGSPISNVSLSSGGSCYGTGAEFAIQFDATGGSGDYEVYATAANADLGISAGDLLGKITGAGAAATGLLIPCLITDPLSLALTLEVDVRDSHDAGCTGGTPVTVNLPACAPDVPTLSQWGLIIFVLMLLSFGTVALIRERKKGVVGES